MKKNLIQLIKKLVSYQTFDGNFEEKQKIIDFCVDWFRKNKIPVKKIAHKKHPALMATLKGKVNKTILLVAHLDVITAEKKDFIVKQKQDILYGRGVVDNKGPASILINKKTFPSKESFLLQ